MHDGSEPGGVPAEDGGLEPEHGDEHLVGQGNLHAPVGKFPDVLTCQSCDARVALGRSRRSVDDGRATSDLRHLEESQELELLRWFLHRTVVEILGEILALLLGHVSQRRQWSRAGHRAVSEAKDVAVRLEIALALRLAWPQESHGIVHKKAAVPDCELVLLIMESLRERVGRDPCGPDHHTTRYDGTIRELHLIVPDLFDGHACSQIKLSLHK